MDAFHILTLQKDIRDVNNSNSTRKLWLLCADTKREMCVSETDFNDHLRIKHPVYNGS